MSYLFLTQRPIIASSVPYWIRSDAVGVQYLIVINKVMNIGSYLPDYANTIMPGDFKVDNKILREYW